MGRRKKKVKLTAEQKKEKKRLLLLAKIEAQRQLVRDHLAREMAITNGTYKVAAETWTQMCTDYTIPELKADLKIFWDDLEDVLTRRDEVANKLLYERCQIEDQYQRNAEEYMNTLDTFIDLNNLFMDAAKKAFDDECRNLLRQFSEECNYRNIIFNETVEKLCDNECGLKIIHDDNKEKAKNLLMLRKNVAVLENVESRNNARDGILDQMENIYAEMIEVVDTLNSALPRDDLRKLEVLEASERSFREKMQTLKSNQRGHYEKYDNLRTEYQKSNTRFQHKVAELMNEQQYFRIIYNQTKGRTTFHDREDKKKLATLVLESNQCIEHLKAQIEKSKYHVQLLDACRRYQTQEEKITPFPKDQKELLKNAIAFKSAVNAIDLPYNAYPDIPKMAIFSYRLAKVEEDCMALETEQKQLEVQNEYLRNEFRRYLDCQKYQKTISKLRLGDKPTVAVPTQQANLIYQVKQTFKKK